MAQVRTLTRAKVIECAVVLIDQAGEFEAVSMTRIAAKLSVRTPSLYNHVRNQQDLRDGVALWGAQQLAKVLRQAAAGLVGVEAVTALAHAYRMFAKQHPGVYPLTQRAPAATNAEMVAAAEELVQLLLLVLASLRLSGDDALHTVRGLRSLVHGFVLLEAGDGFGLPLAIDESFDRLISTFTSGLLEASNGA